MAFEEFKGELDAPAASGGFAPFSGELDAPSGSKPRAAEEVDPADPMGTGAAEIMAAAKPRRESVLEGMQLTAPKFDSGEAARMSLRRNAEADEIARTNSGRPSIRPTTSGPQAKATGDDMLGRAGDLIKSQTIKAASGFGRHLATAADAVGADGISSNLNARASAASDKSQLLEQGIELERAARQIETVQGFAPGSIVQDTKRFADEYLPQILAQSQQIPMAIFGGLAPMVGMSYLSSYADARDAGKSPSEALAYAIPQATFEYVGEKLGGMGRINSAFEKAVSSGFARDAAWRNLGKAFLAAGAKEVPSEELTYGLQFINDKFSPVGLKPNSTWDDFKKGAADTAIVAIGSGGMMAGGGMAISRLAEREKNYAEKYSADPGTLPGVPPAPVDPVAEISKAQTVDQAIAAAQAAVQSSTAVDNIGEILKQNQPAALVIKAQAAIQNIADLSPGVAQATQAITELEAANVSPSPAIQPLAAGTPGSGMPEPGISLEAPLGTERATAPAVDARGVPDQAGGGVVPLGAGPDAVDPRLVPVSQRQNAAQNIPEIIPATPDVQDQPQAGTAAPSQAAPGTGGMEAAGVAGQQIDKEWSAFAPDSGTLSVPRADMPQIKAEHRGAMVNFLNARDIAHTQEEVPAASLKPTQTEFSPAKVAKAMGFTGTDRSILVSSDNHVLDGHHQWMAKLEAGEPVKVIRLDAPIKQLLETVREFPSAEQAAGTTAAAPQRSARQVAIDAERARIEAKRAEKKTARAAASAAPEGLSVGAMPNTAEPVTVKDGVIYIGKYAAQNFETGEDVTVANGASNEQIRDALKSAGALGHKVRVFGVSNLASVGSDIAKQATNSVATENPDSAQQRADFAAAEKVRTAPGNRARARANEANPFKAFLAKHGISGALASEFTPGLRERRAAMVQGYGPIFRRSGMDLDRLAQNAVEEGFLTGPDTAQLAAMIHDALRGKRIIAQYAEGVAETEMADRTARAADIAQEMEQAQNAEVEAENRAERDAIQAVAELRDASLLESDDTLLTAGNNVSEADFLRTLGFSEQEIQDGNDGQDQGQGRARQGDEGRAGAEETAASAAPRGAESRDGQARADGEGLTAPTFSVKLEAGRNTLHGNPQFHEAEAQAKTLPKGQHTLVTVDRAGLYTHSDAEPTRYGAWVSNGDSTATFVEKPFPASRKPLASADIAALHEAATKHEGDRAKKIAEANQHRTDLIESKKLRIGTEWSGAQNYVHGKIGITTFSKSKIISIGPDGFLTVDSTLRGSNRTYRFTVDANSRLFDNYPTAEGLTSPTPADVLDQQQRAATAANRDQREQVRKESEAGAGQFSLTQDEGRQDTTGSLFDQPASPEKSVSKMSAADLLRAAADKMDGKNQEQPSAQPVAESQAPAPKAGEGAVARTRAGAGPVIEDSGQVLEGARKLYAKAYAAKLDEGMDTATVPLSKSWPEPDYQRMLDDGADPWAVAMYARGAPVWRSALRDGIEGINAKALPGNMWADGIKGLINKGTAKADEVEWSGITDWLKLQEGKVTKDQVLAYLDGNGVRVEETMLGERAPFSKEEPGQTKYGQYQLPGGENYKELLLKLPGKTKQVDDEVARRLGADKGWETDDPIYQSSHWQGNQNVLAHIRFNERTDADGKRVLLIEEIQSDWAQEGKKSGFGDARAKVVPLADGGFTLEFSNGTKMGEYKTREDAERGADNIPSKGVPSAPFVGKTDAWVALSIKRMISYAATNGFDKIAFVNGEQSADRYDLSKQISDIQYKKMGPDDYYIVVGGPKGGIHSGRHSASKLEDFVGKELAQRIVDRANEDVQELSGLDLKVGGEGMKAFYDQIVPKVAKDVLRKLGGGQMGTVTIGVGAPSASDGPASAWNFVARPSSEQPGFDITPAMREKAAAGLPMFSRKGFDANAFRRAFQPAQAMQVSEVQKAVDQLSAKWKSGPAIKVVGSPSELPVAAPGDARGLIHNGVAYVVARSHMNRDGVARTLAHEAIGHYGLWKILGEDGMKRFNRNLQLAMRSGNAQLVFGQGTGKLVKLSDKIRDVYVDKDGKYTLNEAQESSEIAAFAIENAIDPATGEFKPGFGFVKEVWAKVADFLRNKLGIYVKFTNTELQGMLVSAMRGLEAGHKLDGGGQVLVAAARDGETAAELNALKALSESDELFTYPKSEQSTVEGITAEVNPAIKVKKIESIPGETRYVFTTPDGNTHRMMVRPFNPYATDDVQTMYGFLLDDNNEMTELVTERPGKNPEAAMGKDDVYIDVSLMQPGEFGAAIYAIAANYAHNSGKIFIGDPAGLSDKAMKRRIENMLSSALKFGTTEHLAPHPRQVNGDPAIGVPALDWTYGDDLGNIRSLLNVSQAIYGPRNPLTFEPVSGRFVDSEGHELDEDAIRSVVRLGRPGTTGVGFKTAKRNAVLSALVREEGSQSRNGGGRVGILERLLALGLQYPVSTRETFYARGAERVDQTDTPATPANPTLSPWRDETGRLQFAPGAWLYDQIGNAASPMLVRLGMKAATPELRRQLRQMKIDVEKAQDVAVAIARETTKLSEAERAMVSDLVEQELKVGVIPPAHAVKLAAMINDAMGRQTDELVSLGMLTKDSADKWRGKYLPRYYESKLKDKLAKTGATWADALMGLTGRQSVMKGIKGKNLKGRGLYETIPESDLKNYEALGWQVRDPDYTPSLPTVDGTVQVWRDFSPAEREKMGEIRDAGFRFVMGYMQTQRDIALGRMFERMAQDPDSSSRLEKEGYVQVPTTVVSGTGAKVYGKLAGRWVPRETMSQLSNIEESTSAAWQMYRKAMAVWKMGKTAMNPVSHVNNIVSNLTMAHLAGISYLRGDKYLAAARDFVKKTPMLQEAKDNGLFLGTLSDTELMNSMPEELRILAQKQESTTLKVARTGFDIMTMFLRKPMGAAYQAEDTFFRYLIYKDARERGTDPQDAVDYAQRYIFTYDDLPKGARRIRDFGIPFFSYTYKAAPALLHTALTHPLRMAAPAAVLWGINAAAYAIAAGDDDDDWQDKIQKYLTNPEFRAKAREQEKLEREHLPPWNKGTTALLTPKMIRLGMDEVTKLPLFIDVSRIIPGGDLFDISPNAGGIPLPQPITPSHPLFTTAVAMLGNKDLFRGKDLVDKNDTKGEAFEKRAAWMWTQLAPAIAAGSYHWERGMNALAQATGKEVTWMPDMLGGDATGIGRDGLPVQPKYAVAQTFGIKIRPMDLDTSAAIDKNMQHKLLRDIDAEMSALRRLESKGAVSQRAVDKARELADMKKDRIKQGLTVDGNERD